MPLSYIKGLLIKVFFFPLWFVKIIMNAGPYVFISFVRNPYSSLMTHEKGMNGQYMNTWPYDEA